MQKKKSLGQHFLHARVHLQKIVTASNVRPDTRVLEIGPGDGALTQALLESGAHVVALEKDSRLIPLLTEKFSQKITEKKLKIIEGDALVFEPKEIAIPYTVVGNIPYYITGALLRKFLSTTNQPETLVFLLQKEVGERIAKSKKESILSLSVKAYGTPRYIGSVPRGAFSPPPSVDSAILQITNISRTLFTDTAHEETFFALLHAGFGQKRKLLRRNIASLFTEDVVERMEKAHVPLDARAEDVPLSSWLLLAGK